MRASASATAALAALAAIPAAALLAAIPAAALPLEATFVPFAAGWEVVEERTQPERDPQLLALGLRESVARHYTRARGPVSEVCTIELWRFASAEQARPAAGSLTEPGWQVHAEGALVVIAHGLRLERGVGARRGLVDGCAALLETTRRRAAAR